MLENPDSQIRFSGIFWIRNHLDKAFIPALRRLATDSDTQNREWVFLCLADFPEKASIPACIRGLEDSSDTVIAMSVKVISTLGAKEAIPGLIALLKRSQASGKKMTVGQNGTKLRGI